VPKQYRVLAGEPVLRRTIRALLQRFRPTDIRVVIDPAHRALYDAAVSGLGLPEPIAGGATRRASVRAGLEALAAAAPEEIWVHDAARPFVSRGLLDRLARMLVEVPAVIPVVPLADSVVRAADGRVQAYVPRNGLARVQTPQAFSFELLLRAHRTVGDESFTDDGSLIQAIGAELAVVEGEVENIKLTTAEDFARAERLLASQGRTVTGYGFDVHAFASGRPLMLCGVRIPHARGLAGHSDADVGLHALTDAVLATMAAGDIGCHFPPTDPRWRDADSAQFVRYALDLLREHGGQLLHVDITLVCEEPKIGPHREAMRARLAALTGLAMARISIKATTTEGLGFTGRGEGMAATAVVTARFREGDG
jgi:2-C-methyl-D-erythritol 4-phosphate cytidylyltransferase/2-C-methyl-D-erythritol 2,4-cyclodiphosphate synthase